MHKYWSCACDFLDRSWFLTHIQNESHQFSQKGKKKIVSLWCLWFIRVKIIKLKLCNDKHFLSKCTWWPFSVLHVCALLLSSCRQYKGTLKTSVFCFLLGNNLKIKTMTHWQFDARCQNHRSRGTSPHSASCSIWDSLKQSWTEVNHPPTAMGNYA